MTTSIAAEKVAIATSAMASLAEVENLLTATRKASRNVLKALLTDDLEAIAAAAEALSQAAGNYDADDCFFRARCLADDAAAL